MVPPVADPAPPEPYPDMEPLELDEAPLFEDYRQNLLDQIEAAENEKPDIELTPEERIAKQELEEFEGFCANHSPEW